MSQIYSGHFQQDAETTILDLGFIPDTFELFINDGTAPDIIKWWKEMVDQGTALYGFLCTGSTGEYTQLTTAASGISAYNSSVNGVLLPAPNGEGKAEAAVIEYAAASTPTARTVLIVGTVVRPSTRNNYIYECTTSSGAVVTEPTWPTVPGNTVTDDGSNVWTCRNEEVSNSGAKGVTIGTSVSQASDGDEAWFIATKSDIDRDKGDAGAAAAGSPI